MENKFASRSPLIVEELEEQLKTLLGNLQVPVQLTCIADKGEKSMEMGAFLNHLTELSPKLSCVFLAPGEKQEYEQVMDGSLLPATGIGTPGAVPRMIFHGIPGGQEISSFASAMLACGGAGKPLDKYTLKDIGKVKKPLKIQICVSLACHHCAQLAANAMRIALENPMVCTHTIDANLYPELVREYSIERVPLMVLNEKDQYPGGKTMGELTTLLAKIK